MTDQEKAAVQERSQAYRSMMNSWAWQDLTARLETEKKTRLDALMSRKGTDDLEFTRGFVGGLAFVTAEASYVMEAQ